MASFYRQDQKLARNTNSKEKFEGEQAKDATPNHPKN